MKYLSLLITGLATWGCVLAASGDEVVLSEAILHNDFSAVSNALAAGASIDAIACPMGDSIMHVAAMNNRLAMAEYIIGQKGNINARDYLGMTPLHWAAYKGHRDMVALLIKHNAKVNAADINGLTPLHLATNYGHEGIITLLLISGADLNARTYAQSMTPLHWAAFSGHTESIKPLLKYGADINARDSEGATPLTWAEEYLHYDMARLIARKGGKRRVN